MDTHVVSQLAWERMVTAVEKVRERLRRAAKALEDAQIPYAVVGGNAVAAWVSEVDESAVRNTPEVNILLRRGDIERAMVALAASGIDTIVNGPNAKARNAVRVLIAGEKVRADDLLPAPDVSDSSVTAAFRVINLEPLVRMKLTAYRTKDCMHLLDMLDVGLIDASWLDRLPPELAERLQTLIDNPEG